MWLPKPARVRSLRSTHASESDRLSTSGRRRHHAFPPRHYRAPSNQGGILTDNDDRAICAFTHCAPCIHGQHSARRFGDSKCVLDLPILRPARGTKPAERQRDPAVSDLAVRLGFYPERASDRGGNRCIADNTDPKTPHRARSASDSRVAMRRSPLSHPISERRHPSPAATWSWTLPRGTLEEEESRMHSLGPEPPRSCSR